MNGIILASIDSNQQFDQLSQRLWVINYYCSYLVHSTMKKYFFLIFVQLFCSFSTYAIQQIDSLKVDSLSLMVGQMLIVGIGDFSYIQKREQIITDVESGIVGGIIIYEKNINKKNPEKQLRRTISTIVEKAETPLFVSIDEEGGKVNRLKPKYGFPKTVTAEYLGGINNIDSTYFYAQATAKILDSLGINLNYAPDIDVAINPDNPVIAKIGRSYSADPNIVSAHAKAVIQAHRENGVLTVLKHFPGHGSSHSDTHKGIADVTNYWQFSELVPYRQLLDAGYVDAIMTAHIVNKHLDPTGLPGTLSPFIISEVLRGFLKYEGVVFTDDMQMHAISKHYGFEESIKLAIQAGVDVLMFAHNVPGNEARSSAEIHQIVMNFVNSGEISEERIRQSYDRIMKLKTKLK